MGWTADSLDAAVRRLARIPDGSSVVSQTEMLAIADEHILGTFVPILRSTGEEWEVATYDFTIGSSIGEYRVPVRATGAALRDIVLLNEDGTSGGSLSRARLEDRERYTTAGSGLWPTGMAFCMQGAEVVILPTPTESRTLRLRYQRRPARLVLTTNAAPIATIVTVSSSLVTVVTVSSAGDLTTGATVDVVQANPHFDTVLMDATATLAAGQWTLAPGAPQNLPGSGLAVGDYLTLRGTSPIVQLPDVMHPPLYRICAATVCKIIGEKSRSDDLLGEADAEIKLARQALTPRVQGEMVRSINRHSALRRGRG